MTFQYILSDGGGGGSTAAPAPVSGSAARRSEPAAWPATDELQTWSPPETRAGAAHGTDHLKAERQRLKDVKKITLKRMK